MRISGRSWAIMALWSAAQRFFCIAVACGSLISCGGSSSSTRTITGSRLQTFWPDSGKLAPRAAWDVGRPLTSVAAHVIDAVGHDRIVPGVLDASGSWRIENAPPDTYFLAFVNSYGVRHFFETNSSSIDLGWDELGRPDLLVARNATPITFQLAGLQLTTSQDAVEITSSNASVFEYVARRGQLPIGVTSATQVIDWSSRPLNIVDGSRGDVAFVHQLSSRVDPSTALVYQAASAWAQLSPVFTVIDGQAQTIPVTLAPVTESGTLSAVWKLSQFESQVRDWPAGAQILDHYIYVEATPWAVEGGPYGSGTPDLLYATARAGTSDSALALTYGRFLPAFWKEYVVVQMMGQVQFAWHGSYISYQASVGILVPIEQAPSTLAPVISPVRGVRISGRDASIAQTGVGAAPALSWTAPASGTPSFYDVDVEELVPSGTSLTFETGATFSVSSTTVQIPEGLLHSGGNYVAFITARAESNASFATAPYRFHSPTAWAETATAPFTP